MLPAAGCFALSVAATACRNTGSSVAGCVNGSVLHHGDCEWRDLPYRRRPGAETFPQATGRAAALQNTLQLGLCFSASLLVSSLIATPLLTTTSVMLISIVGRHRFLDAATTRAVSERIVSRLMILKDLPDQ